MKAPFKKRLVATIFILVAGFFVLFLFRFIYGYTTGLSEFQEESITDYFDNLENSKRNYASDNYKYPKYLNSSRPQQSLPQQSAPVPDKEFDVDQKYEKTATFKSRTKKFEEDEKNLRTKVKDYNAIIQYEENSGNKGSRRLHLLIGIPPELFDTFYVDLQKIGRITATEITKTDKTNEFKTLNAKKASLEITRQSLLEIKKQSGKIEEFINLQNRILEIEQQLQDLGVSLGDFDEENEFCTVRFSLVESREITVSTLHRIKVAFEWAIQYYLLLLGIVALSAFIAFFVLLIIDKVLPSIINRVNQ